MIRSEDEKVLQKSCNGSMKQHFTIPQAGKNSWSQLVCKAALGW